MRRDQNAKRKARDGRRRRPSPDSIPAKRLRQEGILGCTLGIESRRLPWACSPGFDSAATRFSARSGRRHGRGLSRARSARSRGRGQGAPRGVRPGPVAGRRFDREARMLAAVNHPTIAAIYGLEEDGDAVHRHGAREGETLAERLTRGRSRSATRSDRRRNRRGPRGRAREGRHPSRPEAGEHQAHAGRAGSRSSTSASRRRVTSPEAGGHVALADARDGRVPAGSIVARRVHEPRAGPREGATRRTDIWAFGCILYEMLTGRRAFAGETVRTSSPDPDAGAAGKRSRRDAAPRSRAPRRCLEKDPAASARHRRRAA